MKLKGNFGTCYICDNQDKKHGLQTIQPRSFDLAITDPPYNIKYSCPCGLGDSPKTSADLKNSSHFYEDSMTPEEYANWCNGWMTELKRVAANVIFTPGNPNLRMWYILEPDLHDVLIWYKANSQSGASKAAYFLKHEVIIVLRKPAVRYPMSVLVFPLRNGFLHENTYTHPAPKDKTFWKFLIETQKPTSVIDPFLGSGTTAEVCEELGIPWVGYEKDPVYSSDIKLRIEKGMELRKKPKQQKITGYMEEKLLISP